MNLAQTTSEGLVCPVRGCDKKKNRRFTAMGLCQHIIAKHGGEKELARRLGAQYKSR